MLTINRLSLCFTVALGTSLTAAAFGADPVKPIKPTKKGAHNTLRTLNSPARSAITAADILRYTKEGVTVTTTPFMGLRATGDSAELLYNLPSINEDLLLLKQRSYFGKMLNNAGGSFDNHAIIGISGAIISGGFANINHSHDSSMLTEGDLNLKAAELDLAICASHWSNAYFSFSYDSSEPASGSRVQNSRLFLQRGFLTFGNFNESPFYLTAGQSFVPFGLYRSLMVTTPLTKSMARALRRMVLLGYHHGSFSFSLYGFHSQITGGRSSPVNQGGMNLFYLKQINSDSHFRVGFSAITNIADSQGMLGNRLNSTTPTAAPAPQFTGFNGFMLEHAVPGVSIDATYSWREYQCVIEMISSVGHFYKSDLSFDDRAASPKSLHAELDYNTVIFSKHAAFGLSYGQTWQALALNLPKRSLSLIANITPWKNISAGIEVRRDWGYGNNSARGGGKAVVEKAPDRTLVSFKVGVYF